MIDSREVERELLGATLLAPELTAQLTLSGHHFADMVHGAIWEAIRTLHQQGVTPTPPLIVDEARQTARVDPSTVVALVGLGIAVNADTYAREILEAYDLAELMNVFDTGKQQIISDDRPAETIRDNARTALDRIGRHEQRDLRAWADIEAGVIDLIQNGTRHGLPTPWPDLDRYINGLVGSRFYLIAARPGEGKSLMAQGIATHMATRHRKPVLFTSLEMSRTDLGVRIIAAASEVSLDSLQKGNLTEDQWDRVGTAQVELSNMPLVIDDTPEQTMGHIRAAALDLQRGGDLGMVAIDYLQLVKPADERAQREAQVARISRDIKLLSRELDVPVIALSQLNRKSLERTDKRPTLGDLRESGAQEQDADVVILQNLDDQTSELHVQVGKNRHGAKGNFDLQMWGHKAQLRSVTRQGATA